MKSNLFSAGRGAKVNLIEFKVELVRKGITLPQVAENLGISRSALWRKLHGISNFTREEIVVACHLFDIGADRMLEIFFDDI